MKVEILEIRGNWRQVADAARTTIGMKPGTGEPPDHWKKRMLLSEHSPIRLIEVRWRWVDIKYWVSVHLVRHHVGVVPFVRSQRPENIDYDRDEALQSALVNHEVIANAQAIINISRKRLCGLAAQETRDAWKAFLNELKKYEPILVGCCVPECIYRGYCYERPEKSCKYSRSPDFLPRLYQYRCRGFGQ